MDPVSNLLGALEGIALTAVYYVIYAASFWWAFFNTATDLTITNLF